MHLFNEQEAVKIKTKGMSHRNFIIKIGISALSLSIITSACTDLTTHEVDSTVVTTTGGTSSGNASDLLVSSYKDLGNITAQDNIYALFTMTSDELIPP